MPDLISNPIFTDTFTFGDYLICTAVSIILGVLTALAASYKTESSKSFLVSLIALPPIVQTVIMIVNGNIGTGLAVMGAFSLIRFRSAQGSAREIAYIFLTMAAGLACAGGYIGIAAVFTLIMCAVIMVLARIRFTASDAVGMKELKITVPESLNYSHSFDDVFQKYTSSVRLMSVKTSNMGSLYKLFYRVTLKSSEDEFEFINELRCRNGNLEISLGFAPENTEGL